MLGPVRAAGGARRLAPTGPFEEHPKVQRALVELAKRAHTGGASSIMLFPQRGVKYDAYAFAYRTRLPKEMNIPSPPKGPLRATVVVNISGHAQGRVDDRVTGWAERELAQQGWLVEDDAAKFEMLRQACSAETGAVVVDGRKLALERGLIEKMQRASVESDDPELARIASWGNDALRKHFAATNTYNVRLRTPAGVTESFDIARNDPDRIEFATRIQIEIPPTVGEVTVEAWPTGSAEVPSYVEARRYRVHLGRDLFDFEQAMAAAEKYQEAHPEVRWDTAHEDEDLELLRVLPSPVPYQDF